MSHYTSSGDDSGVDVKELQFQLNKLQEQNKLLHNQMAEVEETILLLRSENSILISEMKRQAVSFGIS